MKCQQCGFEISNDAAFCSNCGTKIERPSENQKQGFCQKCDTQNDINAKFCSNCGNNLFEKSTYSTSNISNSNTKINKSVTFENICDALVLSFKNIRDIKGRAEPLEFYTCMIFWFIIQFILMTTFETIPRFLDLLTMIPQISVSIRRMRDANLHIAAAITPFVLEILAYNFNKWPNEGSTGVMLLALASLMSLVVLLALGSRPSAYNK